MALRTEEETLPGRATLGRPAAVPVAPFLQLTEVMLPARFFTKQQSLKNSWPDLCSVTRGPVHTLKPPQVITLFEAFSNQKQIRANGTIELRRKGESEAMAGAPGPLASTEQEPRG